MTMARKRFAEVTRNNIGRQLAIVLDGQLYSAPVIQGAIETGSGQITGHFTPEAGATTGERPAKSAARPAQNCLFQRR